MQPTAALVLAIYQEHLPTAGDGCGRGLGKAAPMDACQNSCIGLPTCSFWIRLRLQFECNLKLYKITITKVLVESEA